METLDKFMHATSNLSRWLPVFLWMAVIFTLSSIPQLQAAPQMVNDFLLKKSAHVTEYAVLYLLAYRATQKNMLLSFFITFGYSLSDEFHQHFVKGRTMSYLDVGFDWIGASISSYVIWKLQQIQKKKPKK